MDKENTLVLIPGKDFTTVGLAAHLNNLHGGKKTGKPFTIGDLQQYSLRGRLPSEYGGHPIVVVTDDQIGIKILSVDFSTSIFD